MSPLLALHIIMLSLLSSATDSAHNRLEQMRTQERQAGLTALEVTVLGLGFLLIAGVGVYMLLFVAPYVPRPHL